MKITHFLTVNPSTVSSCARQKTIIFISYKEKENKSKWKELKRNCKSKKWLILEIKRWNKVKIIWEKEKLKKQ